MKVISIISVIDVVGALATDSLDGNFYLMDSNKAYGSTFQGTQNLKTLVKLGDKLVWNVQPLECEAFASIADIIIDKDICEPKKKLYGGTDVNYWVGIVKKDVEHVPYKIAFKVGIKKEPMVSDTGCSLIG